MAVTYKEAGVDVALGDALVERIKPLARATRTPHVVDDVGGFAGLCRVPPNLEDPVLVSGTDGVGTKLKVAFAANRHDTIGQDLVAMCVNDVLTTGAAPLFFLDYFATSQLDVDVAEQVIRGIADGCRIAGCALLGGETAELPGMYAPGEYDLAGFSVGVVSRKDLLGPDRVNNGDALIAVASSGLHSNGYSLARRVLQEHLGWDLDRQVPEFGRTLADELLEPTRIYTQEVSALKSALGNDLHASCHVTGGGITGNLPRVLRPGQRARVKLDHARPKVFDVIQQHGPVDEDEMRLTFNLGVGLVAIVAGAKANAALAALQNTGTHAWLLGQVEESSKSAPNVAYE